MKKYEQNVGAFDKVLGITTKHGPSYKPSNPAIGSTALQSLLEEAKKSIAAVHDAEVIMARAIASRQKAFEELPVIATSVADIATACDLPSEQMENLKRLKVKFRSKPFEIAKPKTIAAAEGATEPGSGTSTRYNRQLGFESKLQNFDSLIRFLEKEPTYNATEPQFTIEAMREKLVQLQAHMSAVNVAKTELKKARVIRDNVIFGAKQGVYGIVKKVKSYMRGVFGSQSNQFRELSSIKVKTQ